MGNRSSLWKRTLRTVGVSLLSSALLVTSLGLGNTPQNITQREHGRWNIWIAVWWL